MPTDLLDPIFHDEAAAAAHFEAMRWPDGPYCPLCGSFDRVKPTTTPNKAHGSWYHCGACRRRFSSTMGTVCERSHIPLTKWLLAMHLMAASKKGMSAHQLHRMLGVTYKSAWFMAMRIREAMRQLDPNVFGPMGGEGKTAEADETYIGGKERNRHKSQRGKVVGGAYGKETVFSIVERGGSVRSMHLTSVTAATLRPILKAHLDEKTFLVTDDAGQYRHMHRDFRHEVINHSAEEYVRGEAHTNTVEGYFSILKRGIVGTYHHVSQQHLKRYLCEFDFRYNERVALGVEDAERAEKVVRGVVGKRVTYQDTNRSGAEARH
jgi:transposase-like protein